MPDPNTNEQAPDLRSVAERVWCVMYEQDPLRLPFLVFTHARHVEVAEFGVGPYGLMAHARDYEHPERWTLVFRPLQAQSGYDDDWNYPEDWVARGNTESMARDLAVIMLSDYAVEPAVPPPPEL